jgi:methionyl-tRNA formyltransferase
MAETHSGGATKPRILFFGYSEVGYQCLSLLLERGDNVVALITHEDNPNEKIWFKTPAVAAKEKGVPVLTPENVNTPEWRERIAAMKPDLILSVYYRNMIGTKILDLPRLGAWNMHGSLLPKFRGRAPLNWAILKGETETGVTLHEMAEKPDAGGIVGQQSVPIGPDETAVEVFKKMVHAAETVLHRSMKNLLSGKPKLTPQDLSAGSYYGRRTPEDGRIDWSKPAAEIHNLVRAVAPPFPGAFSDFQNKRLKINRTKIENRKHNRPLGPFQENGGWFAACGDGKVLRLLEIEQA